MPWPHAASALLTLSFCAEGPVTNRMAPERLVPPTCRSARSRSNAANASSPGCCRSRLVAAVVPRMVVLKRPLLQPKML